MTLSLLHNLRTYKIGAMTLITSGEQASFITLSSLNWYIHFMVNKAF